MTHTQCLSLNGTYPPSTAVISFNPFNPSLTPLIERLTSTLIGVSANASLNTRLSLSALSEFDCDTEQSLTQRFSPLRSQHTAHSTPTQCTHNTHHYTTLLITLHSPHTYIQALIMPYTYSYVYLRKLQFINKILKNDYDM